MRTGGGGGIFNGIRFSLSLFFFFFTFLLFLFHCQNRVKVVQFMTKKANMPGYTLDSTANRGHGGAVGMGMRSLGRDLAAPVLGLPLCCTCLAG
jgi:hypothetical protein